MEAITIDPIGDVIAGGFTRLDGKTVMMVRKYAPDGTIRWTSTYDTGDPASIIRGVSTGSDGSIYVTREVRDEDGRFSGWVGRLRR